MTGRVTVREFQKIQEHEYMKKAFKHIAGRGKPDRNYIRIGVESFYKKPSQKLTEPSEDCDLLWKEIAEMARQLVIEN
ncbi:hypothetical protein BDV41DRAFT_86340 [Aspergillus transmontanensis]|uniref:Uncharacterized protein n=1 Tax=Aspergillus transmontanensis TaxID=1034304 RepID=A0A5N6VEZ0_9EURO|nr:hypothetical protein BDV41DRAFT_86340 [Aspergillus transmontanensis]